MSEISMREEIKDFPGYFIYRDGRVFSSKSGKFLKPLLSNCQYYQVVLYNFYGSKRLTVHRILANHFLPNINNLPQVNHKDGNKLNNNLENLEWVTESQNIRHAWDSGFMEETRKSNKKQILKNMVLAHAKNRKKVWDTRNGKTFSSISEAAKCYELDNSKLGKKLNGLLFNDTPLRFV